MDITTQQLETLKAFSEKYGKNWKDVLMTKWMNGSAINEHNGHDLQRLRNAGGPTWLTQFTFPK